MPRAVAVVGPTATGKSDVALALAEHFAGEIVNADALQVYRGFDIGTAKPPREEQARVPHHLIDILEPHEAYSAGEFVRRAVPLVESLFERGVQPILVGGSGFYIRALTEGLSPVPAVEEEVREAVRARLENDGAQRLWEELKALDPETAARLAPTDRQRVARAVEVAISTGKSLSSWQKEPPVQRAPFNVVKLGLTLPRGVLYDRIQARLQRMVASGWIEEVRGLLQSGLAIDLPAFQAIGYRQIARHVLEGWPLEEALEDVARETRRFAKRQETWFKREPDVQWFEASPMESEPKVLEYLTSKGLGE